jgi:hypothetical protein
MSNLFVPFRKQHMFHTHINIRYSNTFQEQALRQKYWRLFYSSHANAVRKFTLIKPRLENFLSYTVNVHSTQDSLTHQQPVIFKTTYPRHIDIGKVTYRDRAPFPSHVPTTLNRAPFPSHVPTTLTTWSMFDRAV